MVGEETHTQRLYQGTHMNRIADTLVAMQNQEDVTLPTLRRQLSDVEKGIENMLNAIQMGILTPSTKEQIIAWIEQFRYENKESVEYQKRVIDSFVNAVYVFDDKLVLTYNFKGGTQTIGLSDVEEAFGSDLNGGTPPKKT